MIPDGRKIFVSVVLLIIAGLLANARADRLFLDLRPSEGGANTIIFDHGKEYKHSFIAFRASLSRLGFYIRALQDELPDAAITLQLWRGDSLIITKEIPTVFLDETGAAEIHFNPPVATQVGETLLAVLSIPPELHQKVGWQLRVQDETFNPAHAKSFINNSELANPAAYQAYVAERPTVALQLAGFMTLGVLLWWLPKRNMVARYASLALYALAVSHLQAVSVITVGAYPFLLIISQAIALAGMYLLLRRYMTIVPSLFGAHLFAFTTWYALQLGAGRPWYLMASLLPLVVLAAQRLLQPIARRVSPRVMVVGVVAVLAIILFVWRGLAGLPAAAPGAIVAHPRDVFLDPHQVSDSLKSLSEDVALPWDHFGAYTGIPYILAAAVGLGRGRTHKVMLLFLASAALVSLVPAAASAAALVLPLPPAYLVILVVFALAFFAGHGLQILYNFLGKKDRLVRVLLAAIALLALFDLWQVGARTLELMLI